MYCYNTSKALLSKKSLTLGGSSSASPISFSSWSSESSFADSSWSTASNQFPARKKYINSIFKPSPSFCHAIRDVEKVARLGLEAIRHVCWKRGVWENTESGLRVAGAEKRATLRGANRTRDLRESIVRIERGAVMFDVVRIRAGDNLQLFGFVADIIFELAKSA
jgi:hypothetical protein